MRTEKVIVDPEDIIDVDGTMKAVWNTEVVSQSLRRFGEVSISQDAAIIPEDYAPMIEQAKAQGRRLCISYRPAFGRMQKTLNVELI